MTYKFEKELLTKKSEQIRTICRTLEEANYMIETIIIPTVGSEADIEFWEQIQDQVKEDFNNMGGISGPLKVIVPSPQYLTDQLKLAALNIGLDLIEVKPSPEGTILY